MMNLKQIIPKKRHRFDHTKKKQKTFIGKIITEEIKFSVLENLKFVATEKSNFSEILRKRVDAYFEENKLSKKGNLHMYIKSFVLLSGYIVPFILLLSLHPSLSVALVLWSIMGISIAGIGMSIMHDANHGAFSENSVINVLMGRTLNFIGGSVSNWKIQHNRLHHTYTNIAHYDADVIDKKIVKFTPYYNKSKMHRFQKYYAFFLYGFVTLIWVFAKDFVQQIQYTKMGIYNTSKVSLTLHILKIIGIKLINLFCLIGIPVLFFQFSISEVLIGFFVMHFWAGFLLSLTFQLAHLVEGAQFPLPNEKGIVENDFSIHQLNTTANFATKNKLLTWYVGGLNFQVEHHLFPAICHVHYPKLAPIVKQTAEEYNVQYLENPSLFGAIKSHFNVLDQIGKTPNLMEIID